MDVTLRALNRFGLGARIGERHGIDDPRAWLRAQLDDPDATRLDGPDLDEAGRILRDQGEARRSRDQDRIVEVRRRARELRVEEARQAFSRRVTTDQPFLERLVAFWSNHLCVSVQAKPQIGPLAGHYERTVIRPHVLGRFDEMVLASARHPAMLFYLDNFQSIGPGSTVGRRSARRGNGRGLNENYARELLELHTVGVGGGYAQPDVEALARLLTGWTIGGVGPGSQPDESLGYVFRRFLHEPGDKTVLGRRYGTGERDGERAIRALCAHPSTARFVAEKLARHFIADDPPSSAVDRLARRFAETDGDLREVSLTLIDLDEPWAVEHRKLRTPQDWLVAVWRAVRAEEAPPNVAALTAQLRHPLWAPAAPKGFGDLEREWSDPDALMNRAELARSFGRGAGRAPRMDPTRLLDVVDVPPSDPLVGLVRDDSIPVQERVALVFGGPAFQWR